MLKGAIWQANNIIKDGTFFIPAIKAGTWWKCGSGYYKSVGNLQIKHKPNIII